MFIFVHWELPSLWKRGNTNVEYTVEGRKAMPFWMLAVGTVTLRQTSVTLKVWIIPVTKVSLFYVSGLQELVRVLSLVRALHFEKAGWGNWSWTFFFLESRAIDGLRKKNYGSALFYLILDAMVEMDICKMQKTGKGPKFLFPPLCERFICGNCTFDQAQSNCPALRTSA